MMEYSCAPIVDRSEVSNSSLLNTLFLNHIEHTLDRLTALSEMANLLTGGVAGNHSILLTSLAIHVLF